MKIVEMEMEHLRRIKVRELERVDLGDDISKYPGPILLESQFKKAVLDGEDVVMVLGGKIEGESAWTWIIGSELIYKNPVASLEIILKLEREAVEMFGVKFLYTFNSPDFPFAIRFLERIGFRQKWVTDDFNDKRERILLVKEIN